MFTTVVIIVVVAGGHTTRPLSSYTRQGNPEMPKNTRDTVDLVLPARPARCEADAYT